MVGRGRARLPGGPGSRLPVQPPPGEQRTRRCSRSGSATITSSCAANARSPTVGSSARPASSRVDPAPARLARRAGGVHGDPRGRQPRAKDARGPGRQLGRRLAVVGLGMFALAVEGVARVNEGGVADAWRRLDEAAPLRWRVSTRRSSGGWTFCSCSMCVSGCATTSALPSGAEGRGVRPQDANGLRYPRLPGPLWRRPDRAGPVARGRA